MSATTLPVAESVTRLRGLRVLVGNTPLLAIDLHYQGRPRTIFAKAENLNLTGSIKDRMALYIVRRAYERGTLAPGGPIIEATSGNTGISFAAVGRALGHPVTVFMPNWLSPERRQLIAAFGATVELVSEAEGGFLRAIERAEELAAETPGAFLPRQFANEDNCEAHEVSTAPEIWAQTHGRWGRAPDAFVAGVGTGGTIMGVGRYLRARHPSVQLHPVEPASSPTLSTGHKVGSHRIQGISDEFVPQVVKLSELDAVLAVDDGDAIIMAQRLAAELGLGVGISSGANLLAALEAAERLGPDACVVTVFPDSNKKYLSTDLMRAEPERSDYVAPHVRLLGFRAINRMCDACFDPTDPESAPVWLGKT
jgi:cysteine synthase A